MMRSVSVRAPEHELPQVVVGVTCPVENNAQAIPGWILREIQIRDILMAPNPLFRTERWHTVPQPLVHSRPERPQISNRDVQFERSIRMFDEAVVELRVVPLAQPQDSESQVMDGGQVSEKIDDPVPARSDLLVELSLR